MVFDPRSELEIRDLLLGGLVLRTKLSNVRENATLMQLVQSTARLIAYGERGLSKIRDTIDLSKIREPDLLDEHAAAVLPDGVTRSKDTYAAGPVVFTRPLTAGVMSIPLGTIIAQETSTGDVRYETTVAGQIDNLKSVSDPINARCMEKGSVGSAAAEAINILISSLAEASVTVKNLSSLTGLDEESNAQLVQKMKAAIRGLAKTTPSALTAAVRSVELVDERRIRSAWATLITPGKGIIYVDDGTGTILETDTADAETLISGSVGGEYLFYTTRRPWFSAPQVFRGPDAGPQLALIHGVDYTRVYEWGQIRLIVPLVADETLKVGTCSVHIGLIAEAQKVIDGSPVDRINYPGFRAAFTSCAVQAAQVSFQEIDIDVTIHASFDNTAVQAVVESEVITYVNSLGPGDPMYHSRLIERVMSVRGLLKAVISKPVSDVHVAENTVIRTDSNKVTAS